MSRNTKKVPENILNVEDVKIPSTVLFDPELTARERILYGILHSLASRAEDGHVYATNNDFGKVLGVDPQIASNAISALREKDYIIVEYGILTEGGDFKFERYEGEESWSRIRRIRPVPQN